MAPHLPDLSLHWRGTTQVALEGLKCASNAEIWDFAPNNDFVVVSKDADFEELSVIKGSPPKVIWLRLGNVSNQQILR